MFGGGVSYADFDQDGYDDITIATDTGRKILFYRNLGNGTFTLLPPLVPQQYFAKQVLWVDIDNDGDLDFYVSHFGNGSGSPDDGQNRIFENTGNLVLVDITATSGLPIQNDNTSGTVFGDYNKDGYLDMYVSNYSNAHSNKLYRNNGNKTFTDVTTQMGLSQAPGLNFCSAFLDYDNDGDVDLYTIVDRYDQENKLFRNDGSTYTNVSSASGTNISIDAMNAGVGDYDNDGDLDIYVSNTFGGNVLLRNNGNGTFTDVAVAAGVSYNQVAWSGVFVDCDNDRDLDLYVCGMLNSHAGRSKLYKNLGNGTFEEYNTGGLLNDTLTSFSSCIGDYNNDGRMDIIVSNVSNDKVQFWANNVNNSNHYVKVKLEGTVSNKKGVGSWIEVYDGQGKQVRFTHCGLNYLGQNSYVEHIGMGTSMHIDSIIVRWASGIVTKVVNLGVDQVHNIKESDCPENFQIPPSQLNNYIGATNGDLTLPANWSLGIVPTADHYVGINNLNPGLVVLENVGTLECKQIVLTGNIDFTNKGFISISGGKSDGLVVKSGAKFTNRKTLNISDTCKKFLNIFGEFVEKGRTNIIR
jgi:hypothetical protein